MGEYRFALVDRCLLNLVLEVGNLLLQLAHGTLYILLYLTTLGTQFVIGECLDGRVGCLDLID